MPTLVVLHYTAMDSCAAAVARLCDPAAEVSAHWVVDTDGTCIPLVDEGARAWHAGAGSWGGREDVNSRSIGIELVNTGRTPFAHRQMTALEGLLAGIMGRWPILPPGIIGHSDMAPGRKVDPGVHFDWRRLARAGLSVWPDDLPGDVPADPAMFLRAAVAFGYPALDQGTVLAAFRMRFRPWATGPVDTVDAGLAADLARRFPPA